MRKKQLAQRLAKQSHISTAAAADQLDRMVSEILVRVRKGQRAPFPGLGTFLPCAGADFRFEPCGSPAEKGPVEAKDAR